MFTSNANKTKITTQSISFKTDKNYSRILHFGRNKLTMILVVKYAFLFSSFNYRNVCLNILIRNMIQFCYWPNDWIVLWLWLTYCPSRPIRNLRSYMNVNSKKPRVFPQALVILAPIPQGPLCKLVILKGTHYNSAFKNYYCS